MSSNQTQDKVAAKMLGAVMSALQSKCTCEACEGLRTIGADMIAALMNPAKDAKVHRTRK